jgi:hypothetical protein
MSTLRKLYEQYASLPSRSHRQEHALYVAATILLTQWPPPWRVKAAIHELRAAFQTD